MKVQLSLEKNDKIIWVAAVMLLAAFYISQPIALLRQAIGIVMIFALPGVLILNKHSLERLVFAPVISVSFIISLTFFLNLWLGIKIDNNFLDKLLPILFAGIFVYRIFFKQQASEKSISKYFILILILSIAPRILIVSKIGSLIGTDIVKFATISHVMKLKGVITQNMQPYSLEYSFFYFPLPFTLPLVIETLGIDPITSITFFSFFFNILTIIAFYLLTSKILDQKKALYATLFYSLFFDISLDYLMSRGVFAFSISFLPSFLVMYLLLEYFDNKRHFLLMIFSLLFLFQTHWFLSFVIGAFFLSLVVYEYHTTKKFVVVKKISIDLLKAVLIVLALSLPFLLMFGPSYPVQQAEKSADWKIYESDVEKISFEDKLMSLIFANFATPIMAASYSLGLLVSVLTIKELLKDKRLIITIFLLLLFTSSFFYMHSITWKRSADYLKIVYPVSYSLLFSHPAFVGIALVASPLVENTPIWYYLNVPENVKEEYKFFFDVVGKDELKAFEFIKNNVSEDAIFLIDGGGAGCVGARPFSHEERMFPLTSRRVFYFTNSCPFQFDWKDYQKRVDIYRRISINPNDATTLEELKRYNVTHVYVGPNSVGLQPLLLSSSANYKMIYHEGNVTIYEIK